MPTLTERLNKAIQLRKEEKLEEARTTLLQLHSEFAEDAQVNLQCAWIHDRLGLEREAIPFYEKAVQLGITGEDLRDTLLGMGSTYRALGEYQKAKETFERAILEFPENNEFKAFLALALYNLGEHNCAMQLLLNTLLDTSKDQNILDYERALRFYTEHLDETW